MRALNCPVYNASDVYQTCVDSITNIELKGRLNFIKDNVVGDMNNYLTKVVRGDLYQIRPFLGQNHDVVIGAVNKLELKSIYNDHMVGKTKPAREIYNALRLSSPLDICPFCGFGQVGTLDHYLPKAKFPTLSVLPINLVPSCIDCNKGKSSGVANTASKQCIHPYFDHDKFTTEQWLFAEVTETSPASLVYVVRPPVLWDQVDKDRVQAHFTDFKLSGRYAIQAANELANLKDYLQYDFESDGIEGVRAELFKRARIAFSRYRNNWDTAMYQALSGSNWYCNQGFMSE